MKQIVGIYIRMTEDEVERLRKNPDILPLYDPRVALADGRGLDLGRAWEELGVFLDGGVAVPEAGPTVGEVPLPNTDARATWSYIEADRVAELAARLARFNDEHFYRRYVTEGDTLDIPLVRTDGWGDRAAYLCGKLSNLARHFAAAAAAGDAMLIRIGERI